MAASGSSGAKGRSSGIGWFRGIALDADDIDLLAAFWSSLLGVQIAEQFDDWIRLEAGRGGGYLAFQPREEPSSGFPVRPDVEVDDLDAATTRIEQLGGRLVDVVDESEGDTHHVMADPEGNEFCLVKPIPPSGSASAAS
ncbi:MAG TPA: VOC family protein [Acidimicrobiia bacterium]|nr:VOC family protein [Acidimicrobiia bacterium]